MKALEQSGGEDHPDYATTLNNLAGLYRLTGDYPRSEQLFNQAIDVYERTIGRNHFLYASALNNLGLLYQNMGKFEEAEGLYRQALEIVLRLEGRSVAYATSLANLASLCMRSKEYNEAKGVLTEALGIYASEVGKGHPLYVSALNTLPPSHMAKEIIPKRKGSTLGAGILQACFWYGPPRLYFRHG